MPRTEEEGLPQTDNTRYPIPAQSVNTQSESYSRNPSHWWFICTSFPIFASAIEPMASAFTVCALVENWREPSRIDNEGRLAVSISNPAWLTTLTAISLATSLLATSTLALDMTKRLSGTTKTRLFIILGWYTSSAILIALVSIISSPTYLSPSPQTTATLIPGQSFYYAAIAGGLHFAAATLMLVSVYTACHRGFYTDDFRATMAHPTLLLKLTAFATYLLGGGAVFARVEGWSFLDAVYWADVTILTVGIGELTPRTHLGRSLLFPYAIGGVSLLGFAVESIHGFVRERKRKRLRVLIGRKRWKVFERELSGRYDGGPRLNGRNPSEGPVRWCGFSEEEFNAMRRIQWSAASQMVRNTFFGALMAWIMLWLFSALVFKRAEREQGWTYFESIYFTYTSLMTIGYGDLVPKSNLAKPFFVFWSLLAVPILTILIGAIDGKLFQELKALVLWGWRLGGREGAWISKWTRERKGMFQSQRSGTANRIRGHAESIDEERTSGYRMGGTTSTLSKDCSNRGAKMVRTQSTIGTNKDCIPKQDAPGDRYALIEEMIDVVHDLSSSFRKKHYTYKEWMQFLKLFARSDEPSKFPVSLPGLNGGSIEREQEVSNSFAGDHENDILGLQGWFGDNGPFFGETTETEWVLDQIMVALKRVLKQEFEHCRERLG